MKRKETIIVIRPTGNIGSLDTISLSNNNNKPIGVSVDAQKLKWSPNHPSTVDTESSIAVLKLWTSTRFCPLSVRDPAASRLLERMRLITMQAAALRSNYSSSTKSNFSTIDTQQRHFSATTIDKIKGGSAMVVFIIICVLLLFHYSGN